MVATSPVAAEPGGRARRGRGGRHTIQGWDRWRRTRWSGRAAVTRSALPMTGWAPISPCSRRWPSAWSCACSPRTAPRPGCRCTRWTASSGTATCPASGPASGTGTGCTGPTTRRPGSGATRPSCCSTRTPRRSRAACTWDQAVFAYPFGEPDEPQRHRLGAATCPARWSSTRTSTGTTTGRRGRRTTRRVIYEAHVRGLTKLHPEVPAEQRGTYQGLAHPRSSTTCTGWASPPSS